MNGDRRTTRLALAAAPLTAALTLAIASNDPAAACGPQAPPRASSRTIPDPTAAATAEALISSGAAIDLDEDGIPRVCETNLDLESLVGGAFQPRGSLPAGTRGWECIPSVVRSDGAEPIYLEVNANGPVNQVRLINNYPFLFNWPGPSPLVLHDDGLNGDRVAGDMIHTGGPFYANAAWFEAPPYIYYDDFDDPAGVNIGDLGTIEIVETGGAVTGFLLNPVLGILYSGTPSTALRTLAPGIVASPHVINLRTTSANTQPIMRSAGGSFDALTLPILQVIADDCDMFTLLSTYKVERTPSGASQNFVAGAHGNIRSAWTGTGQGMFDSSALFGSNGVLMGVNMLDTMQRGLWASVMTHEIMHQWGAYLHSSLGLGSTGGHYNARSSVASPLGGFQWTPLGNGTYSVDCNVGANGQYQAPPLDKYLAGFLPGASVPPLLVNNAVPPCDLNPRTPEFSVSIAQIQAIHGVRTPDPATSQKDFVMPFVAESVNRMLTPTEMTYYEIFASHLGTPVLEGAPDPLLGQGWKSMSRYWGPGVTWSTAVPLLGDMDRNGLVNTLDIPLFVQSLLQPATVNARTLRRADCNRDNVVDGRDVQKFLTLIAT